jgi:hypothetical protein
VATAFGEIYQYLVEGDASDAMDEEDAPRLGDADAAAFGAGRERDQLVGRTDEAVPRGRRPRQLERYGLSLGRLS